MLEGKAKDLIAGALVMLCMYIHLPTQSEQSKQKEGMVRNCFEILEKKGGRKQQRRPLSFQQPIEELK